MDLLRGTREVESHGIGLEDWEAREGSVTTIGSTKIKSTESGSVETWSVKDQGYY